MVRRLLSIGKEKRLIHGIYLFFWRKQNLGMQNTRFCENTRSVMSFKCSLGNNDIFSFSTLIFFWVVVKNHFGSQNLVQEAIFIRKCQKIEKCTFHFCKKIFCLRRLGWVKFGSFKSESDSIYLRSVGASHTRKLRATPSQYIGSFPWNAHPNSVFSAAQWPACLKKHLNT